MSFVWRPPLAILSRRLKRELSDLGQWFPTPSLEDLEQYTFRMAPLSELNRVCLDKQTSEMCTVGGPPGTRVGTGDVEDT